MAAWSVLKDFASFCISLLFRTQNKNPKFHEEYKTCYCVFLTYFTKELSFRALTLVCLIKAMFIQNFEKKINSIHHRTEWICAIFRYAGLAQPFVTSLLLYVAIHAQSKCIIICLVLPNLHMNEVYNFNAEFYRMYFI
jgi:hypothetical protein